ncbi:hypothetical protein J4460_05305 [Candidatus Woesearchaeota archaeon]|nr:hypothetical protein [Candidatus Woesearchaeota archaeon]HIH38114.1 hypothetical protein [Candidatus Woesearchaeota archaeon]HIH49387.1 hypothetical protein [Candidatus Woesearchaeota archaeon]HIJ04373.1 hypothetical protein [Candidatus Woesearchaeota archaeon]
MNKPSPFILVLQFILSGLFGLLFGLIGAVVASLIIHDHPVAETLAFIVRGFYVGYVIGCALTILIEARIYKRQGNLSGMLLGIVLASFIVFILSKPLLRFTYIFWPLFLFLFPYLIVVGYHRWGKGRGRDDPEEDKKKTVKGKTA